MVRLAERINGSKAFRRYLLRDGPDGVTRDNQYDGQGRLAGIVHFNDLNNDGTRQANETLVAQFNYTYDNAGNRTSSTELLGGVEQTFTYAYDGLNRLVREALTSSTNPERNYVTTFAFDLASNRTNLTRDDGADGTVDESINYVYDANDRLLSETSSTDGTTTYAYDRTQQIERVTGDGTVTTQTYDVQGRLATVTIDDGQGNVTEESYTYGLDGIRTSRTVNGETTVFLYDNQNPTGFAQILEQGVDANGDGRLQAEEVNTAFTVGLDVITQATVGQVLHLLYDVHGSTRALTDVDGQIANVDGASQSFTYDAYGQAIGFSAAQAATNLLFSGEFTNANTGSLYLRARYYDPASGRFNRLDPFAGDVTNPLTFNRYAFGNGNPISNVDPAGLFSLTETVASVGISNVLLGILAGAVLVDDFPTNSDFGTDISRGDITDLMQVQTLARLVADVYNAQSSAIGEFRPIADLSSNPVTGFQSQVYFNASTETYVLAFAGTDDLPDWYSNIVQGLGLPTPQYIEAVNLAEDMDELARSQGAGLLIIGHSLGGGLAAASALATGRSATTFNAAGVSLTTRIALGGFGASTENITNYSVAGELLTGLQTIGPVVPNAIGNQLNLQPGNSHRDAGRVELHGKDSVLDALGIL